MAVLDSLELVVEVLQSRRCLESTSHPTGAGHRCVAARAQFLVPIIPELFPITDKTYYSQNYSRIFSASLTRTDSPRLSLGPGFSSTSPAFTNRAKMSDATQRSPYLAVAMVSLVLLAAIKRFLILFRLHCFLESAST